MNCYPKNYILVIAEKSKAAKKIAEALSDKPTTCKKYSVSYWVVNYKGKVNVVAPAAGHLFNLYGDSSFPIFSMDWKPLWEIDDSAKYTKKYYNLLKDLSKYAIEYINACDYDIEGSVIGYMIIKHFGDLKKAKRMKFSALTKQDIQKAYSNLSPLDYNMINAGIARHKVDWIWGINVSRALMLAVSSVTKKRVTLSAGRVQSPTLIHVVENEIARELYIPLPVYRVRVKIKIGNETFSLSLNRTFEYKEEAQEFANKIKKSRAVVDEVRIEEKPLTRPSPFNLGDLQAEAGRILGYSPYYVERLAEELYLDGLISYPRTNSQKIPPSVDIKSIVNGLEANFKNLVGLVRNITKGEYIVRQGSKDDPAHPAIYPTGNRITEKLGIKQYKLFELITRRFLASISRDAIMITQKIIIRFKDVDISDEITRQKIKFKGWLLLYPYHSVKDEELLDVKEGEEVKIESVSVKMDLAKPDVKRYNKVQLLKWMETSNLGTEATRGKIIETLFNRKYLSQKRGTIYPTSLGIVIVEVLKDYFKDLTSIELTSKMEEKLNEILDGKETVEGVVAETINTLRIYLDNYNKYKDQIGIKLAKILGLMKYKKCKFCDLEAEYDNLCKYHYNAYMKLKETLKVWKERTKLEDKDILKKIYSSKTTGKYIKDMISEMM
ncbi:DNA topoisomerase I [Sulfurisphaera tokodaii]|uniref:DNA topoisomerase n=2 Tax=Sulfurisphaera tokodaii TaxID=111955 RepID=Q972B2_SULTO|nr:DNA topoisomerase I [Sulfurisphaera tokodaii]BAB66257.1 DNA topoisomerase III [Sulfurisphaera tokodaii str. 7]HII73237.1 DNA topoisomerase I [Sulfurisphaera tokodaii]